ncbi:hypothetical protein [Kitasatospora purpeofusca]|uniref:hypothetical protein n=1 Tax=Kitasatospora purpeofusca TaxID=67352 RepID=UPI0035E1213C
MTASDDPTTRGAGDSLQPSGLQPGSVDENRPLRQRIADGWNGLGPAGKAGAIIVGAVVVLGAVFARAASHANADIVMEAEETEPLVGGWTNHAGGYLTCGHMGCSKKANPTITGHDCCGRCRDSRWRDCWGAAQSSYDGPGYHAHNYFETILHPGVCADCDEPSDVHQWVYDFRTGQRR